MQGNESPPGKAYQSRPVITAGGAAISKIRIKNVGAALLHKDDIALLDLRLHTMNIYNS